MGKLPHLGQKQTKRLFMRYLMLYMGVFLLMLFFLLLIYRSVSFSAQNTLVSSYENHLERTADILEQTVDQCQRASYMLREQSAITQLSMARPETVRNYIVQMNNAYTLLRKDHSLIGAEVTASFLMYRHNPYLVSNFFVSDNYQTEYPSLFSFGGDSAIQWRERMLAPSGSPALFPQTTMYSVYLQRQSGKAILPLVIPMESEVGTALANMVYCIDADWLAAQAVNSQMVGDGLLFSLENLQGELLLGQPQPEDTAAYLTFSSRVLQTSGVFFRLSIPRAAFRSEVSSVIRLIKTYVICGLLVAFAMSMGYAAYHFMNVHHTMQAVNLDESALPGHTSPYRHIQDMLQSLSKTSNELSKQLLLVENAYTNNLLQNICVRGLSSAKERNAAQQILLAQGVPCCVAVMKIDAQHRASLAFLEAANQFTAHTRAIALHCRPEESVFIIPSGGMPAETLPDEVTACLAPYGMIGISLSCMEAEALHSRYQQAHNALLHCNEQQRVCQATDPAQSEVVAFDLEKLSVLQNLIQTGKTQQVEQFFADLLDRADAIVGVNQLQLFFVLRQLLRRLSQEIQSAQADQQPALIPQADESTREGLLRLESYACALSETVNSALSSRASQPVQMILSIIETEFRNPALSADYLAQRMNYSSKHIYHMVKEQTGKTVGDLIEETRLQFAAEMLQHTNKTNEEIAQLCGFGTINTFYRVFKRKYGVAPGEWRSASKTEK